jgi:hypothetical protein
MLMEEIEDVSRVRICFSGGPCERGDEGPGATEGRVWL